MKQKAVPKSAMLWLLKSSGSAAQQILQSASELQTRGTSLTTAWRTAAGSEKKVDNSNKEDKQLFEGTSANSVQAGNGGGREYERR